MKIVLSSIKNQLTENQKSVISAQESIIVVKDTVESQFKSKSYSDAVQENVMVCQPESSVTPET